MGPKAQELRVIPPHLVEDVLESLLCESGAFHILHSPQLFCQTLSHLQAQWLLLVLCWKGGEFVQRHFKEYVQS